MEAAKIHAENAIHQKHQSLNLLRMSARVDAVVSRVQTAVMLNQVSSLMDKFEKQFETLDVQTVQMEDTMGDTTTLMTPQNEGDMLIHEMADEAGTSSPRGCPGCETRRHNDAEQRARREKITGARKRHGAQRGERTNEKDAKLCALSRYFDERDVCSLFEHARFVGSFTKYSDPH